MSAADGRVTHAINTHDWTALSEEATADTSLATFCYSQYQHPGFKLCEAYWNYATAVAEYNQQNFKAARLALIAATDDITYLGQYVKSAATEKSYDALVEQTAHLTSQLPADSL